MLGAGIAAAWVSSGAGLAAVLGAFFIVLLVENSRVPFDDPATHLELTMVHEVMVLDHGGPPFGLVLWGSALKLFVFGALVAGVATPVGLVDRWIAWPVFAGVMILLAVTVGIVESVMARLRLLQVPNLLVAACLMAAFGAVLLVR
jgi:formate hydrogenlyase subunit 4